MGEVVRLSGGKVTLQDAVDAFLDHHDLARSTQRVYRASLVSLVVEFGSATAVSELSGPMLAGWFRGRRRGGAGDLEPGASHPAGGGRLVAPPRMARRRPDRRP